MISRQLDQEMQRWLGRGRRKPLVLRGARQVGKTELVRASVAVAGLRLAEVNIERHPELERVFQTNDPAAILDEVSFVAGHRPKAGADVLFLDEIQAAPSALPALRYLAEDEPELPVVAAGSLLEFSLAEHSYTMPVGRIEYGFLGPLTFEDFLGALGEEQPLRLLQTWTWGKPFPEAAHRRLLAALRQFLLVGGMPEAAARFVESRDFGEVATVHASILETYRDDFGKYASAARIPLLRQAFDFVPGNVGHKVKYTAIAPDARAADVRQALELLCQARVVLPVVHSDATGVPLGANARQRTFKTFFLDVGLLSHACGLRRLAVDEMAQARFVNEGGIAEQFVAQHLLFADSGFHTRPELHYWLREQRRNNAEVDFLLAVDMRVVPVEVKAGAGGSLKSLLQFVAERGSPLAVRFDTEPPRRDRLRHRLGGSPETTREIAFELLSLPLYCVGQTHRLIREAMPPQ